jgi:hypothetical protein
MIPIKPQVVRQWIRFLNYLFVFIGEGGLMGLQSLEGLTVALGSNGDWQFPFLLSGNV